MISFSDLTFRYPGGKFCLNIPSFEVETGSRVAIVGPSGSGKTTLLNLAAGILLAESGKVTTGGADIGSMNDAERRSFRVTQIGLVFQEFELLEHLSVLDNILLPCRITNQIKLKPQHRSRAEQLAGELGIGDKLRRFPRNLSQGERQRVAVCRALLLQPPLLLCDEPTGNLDPQNKQHVLDVLFDYCAAQNATLLTVTHDHGLLHGFDKTVDVDRFHARANVERLKP